MDDVRGKVGSLIVAGFSDTLPPENLRDKIENDSLGGVILFARNYRDQNQLSELTANLHRIASARLLTAVDQEGGRVVRFSEDFPTYPSAYYYGCRNDRQGYLESAILTAERLKSVGVNLNLLPVCDLAPPEKSHIIYGRSYSADPETLAEVNKELVRRLTAENIMTCAKHFPGLATAEGDPHHTHAISEQSLADFRARDYPPFAAAIEAGVSMVMVTHLIAEKIDPGHIATYSHRFIEDELRGYLAFDGIIVTDDLQMAAAATGVTPAEAACKALLAGCNLLIFSQLDNELDTVIDAIVQEAENNKSLADTIAASNLQVLQFRNEFADFF